MPKAKTAVAKALEIDDQLAEAYSVLGMIRNFYDRDKPGAEEAHQRALELNANTEITHRLYAIFLVTIGRLNEALVEIDRALALDPLSVVVNKDKGQILCRAGQYDRAIEQLQKTLDLDPNFPSVYGWLELAYEAKHDYDQAIVADLKQITVSGGSPEDVAALREANKVSGWKGYWRKKLELVQEQAKRRSYVDPYKFVPLYARLGEKEHVFEWLEKSYAERSGLLNFIKVDLPLDGLRSDPRFTDLLRRMGLTP